MKIKNVLLALLVLFCFSAVSYADVINKPSTTLKWKPVSADSVSAKANQDCVYGKESSGSIGDPIVNGMMNGYYNMMRGGISNAYELQEMQKQQLDYVRQQSKQIESNED